jgi:hypothetical protein
MEFIENRYRSARHLASGRGFCGKNRQFAAESMRQGQSMALFLAAKRR